MEGYLTLRQIKYQQQINIATPSFFDLRLEIVRGTIDTVFLEEFASLRSLNFNVSLAT